MKNYLILISIFVIFILVIFQSYIENKKFLKKEYNNNNNLEKNVIV